MYKYIYIYVSQYVYDIIELIRFWFGWWKRPSALSRALVRAWAFDKNPTFFSPGFWKILTFNIFQWSQNVIFSQCWRVLQWWVFPLSAKKSYFQLYHGFANIFPENIMIVAFPNDIYIYSNHKHVIPPHKVGQNFYDKNEASSRWSRGQVVENHGDSPET